jgi:hypothetical protein
MMLEDIDYKLNGQNYREKRQMYCRVDGQMVDLPDKIIKRYSASELSAMFKRKSNIIDSLHKIGIIDEYEYIKYLLSDNPLFTPKLLT